MTGPRTAGHKLLDGCREARVTFDPAQVTVEQLIKAVNRAGFRAALKAGGAN